MVHGRTSEHDEAVRSRTLHAWYDYTKRELFREERERAAQAGWRGTYQWARQLARRLIYLEAPRAWAREAWGVVRNLRCYGRAVREEFNVSLREQLEGMKHMILKADIPLEGEIPIDDWHYVPDYPDKATFYYGYRLYEPERWKHVDEYIYYSWPLHPGINHLYREGTGLYGKLRFFERCREHGIPTPPVVAAIEDGTVTFPSGEEGRLPTTDLFVKRSSGSGGHGAAVYAYDGGRYRGSDGSAYDAGTLLDRLRDRANGKTLLVQPKMENHPDWQPFSSGALITMRVVTGRTPEGSIEPLAACFRMPVGQMLVDNISSGGIASPVDLQTGRLGRAVRKLPYDGIFGFDIHPDTQQTISGTEVPRWREALEFACRVHEAFETLFVGWDIALTSEGFVAVEGNLGWEARLMEITGDKPLARTCYAELYDAWMRQKTGHGPAPGENASASGD